MTIPKEVLLSDIANLVDYALNEKYNVLSGLEQEIQPIKDFIQKHDPSIASEYFNNLLRECPDKSIEELQDIVNTMPGGLYRAEIRAILKSKLSK